MLLRGDVPHHLFARMHERVPVPLTVVYVASARGGQFQTTATLQVDEAGERWTITEREVVEPVAPEYGRAQW